jgi:RNA-directed DNA polymerase
MPTRSRRYQNRQGQKPETAMNHDADLRRVRPSTTTSLSACSGRSPAGMIRLADGGRGRASLAPTGRVPCRGVISPLLLNIVLHGMEARPGSGIKRSRGIETAPDILMLVATPTTCWRCATTAARGTSQAQAGQWLAPRGPVFNEARAESSTSAIASLGSTSPLPRPAA